MTKTGDIRKHNPALFSPLSIGAMGHCGIHNHARGVCDPPVIDFYTERHAQHPSAGFWKALCRYHANMKGVSDEQIERVLDAAPPVGTWCTKHSDFTTESVMLFVSDDSMYASQFFVCLPCLVTCKIVGGRIEPLYGAADRVPSVVPWCAGTLVNAHSSTPMVVDGERLRCPVCGELE